MGLNADEGDGGDFQGLQGAQNLGECHGEEGLVVGDGGGWKNRSELAHGSSETRGVLGREEERDGESASSMDEFLGCRYDRREFMYSGAEAFLDVADQYSVFLG